MIEVLDGQIIDWPPYVATPHRLSAKNVWVEEHPTTGNQFDDWPTYADLRSYRALGLFNEGKRLQARLLYIGLIIDFKRNGKGFEDAVYAASVKEGEGHYETYKLALALIAGHRLGFPVNRQILAALLAQQADSGGFVTHYNEEGEARGDTNVETTALALLALTEVSRADP